MEKYLPSVSKERLLIIAGVVWLAVGVNIARIGIPDMIGHWHLPLLSLLVSVGVFLLFFCGIFYKMVQKHFKRIMGYAEEKVMILKFFDKKAYMIMTFMMTFGITLRHAHLLLPQCLGVFYTGLGLSLAAAGVNFFWCYFKNKEGEKEGNKEVV